MQANPRPVLGRKDPATERLLLGAVPKCFGSNLAIGAQRGDVLRLVMGEGFKLAALGVALGLIGARLLTHVLDRLLFGITATDPLIFAANAALLIIVALVACAIPARRAARVDPMTALRYE